ncbi:hypothetical protein LCGC14_2049670, partial [marine sediment metagenome]
MVYKDGMKKMELTSLKQKNPEQSKVLEELESIIGKNIPIVDRIAAGVLGVIVENNNVVELGLSEQNLLSLPESIENLESLRILQLYKNQLTTLPESIGELKALTGLYLHSNNLTYLPESLGNLISLKELELSNNKLNALPNSFWKLKKLKTIDLTNNPLNVDYNSMNESNAQSILDFCRKLATIDIFISHAVEDYEYFQIKNISQPDRRNGLTMQWLDSGDGTLGSAVTFKHGQFGYDRTNIATYQKIAIPFSNFGATGDTINKLQFTVANF